jgi:hypothetical protein
VELKPFIWPMAEDFEQEIEPEPEYDDPVEITSMLCFCGSPLSNPIHNRAIVEKNMPWAADSYHFYQPDLCIGYQHTP